jgi:copper homeostasis protein
MLIEIAVYSLEAAIVAQKAGARRIELCTAPAEGGLTPSAATLRLTRKYLSIPIHVMIRPREGDFCYSQREFESMLLDVEAACIAGMDGIVTGVLLKDGNIDAGRMKMLVEAAGTMNVTCHRAFDMAADPFRALEDLVSCGVERILTSGRKQTALEGISLINEVSKHAAGRIKIMPGSGINENNIIQIAGIPGVEEVHLSAKKLVPGKMEYHNPEISMGGKSEIPEYDLLLPDAGIINRIMELFTV